MEQFTRNIPNGQKMSKYPQIHIPELGVWYENIPSGNPALVPSVLKASNVESVIVPFANKYKNASQ
jgi:hypothetical protein